MIAYVAVLAQLVRPMRVGRFPVLPLHHRLLAELDVVRQLQPQPRPHQQRLAIHRDAVPQRCIRMDGQRDLPIRRLHLPRRPPRQAQHRRARQQNRRHQHTYVQAHMTIVHDIPPVKLLALHLGHALIHQRGPHCPPNASPVNSPGRRARVRYEKAMKATPREHVAQLLAGRKLRETPIAIPVAQVIRDAAAQRMRAWMGKEMLLPHRAWGQEARVTRAGTRPNPYTSSARPPRHPPPAPWSPPRGAQNHSCRYTPAAPANASRGTCRSRRSSRVCRR